MNGDIGIGKIITEERGRDAIHIAVAPVVAAENLYPGTDIGIYKDGTAGSNAKPFVGIVDPFLDNNVQKGQKFYVFLYPGTITSLRHEWVHPAFKEKGELAKDYVSASKAWIMVFAEKIDQTYSSLMAAADEFVTHREYTYDNTEKYKDQWDQFPEFWKHYEIVTGRKVDDDDKLSFFTCSC